ncbi:MAG: hypothetical protein ACLSTO_00100 [Bilophila wadsworthia]
MDATIQGLRLPEGFAGMLEDNGLPLPPLPLEAINELEQTDEWFFATDGREPLSGLAGLYLEDLDAVFDSPEAPQASGKAPSAILAAGSSAGGSRVGSSAICWMRAACASGCRFRGGAHGTIPKRNACPLRRLAALSRPAKPACPNRAC